MQLSVPDQLRALIRTRRQWVEQVGGVFEEKHRLEPGRVRGLPERSVFEGIEDGSAREAAGPSGSGAGPSSAVHANGIDRAATPSGNGAPALRWSGSFSGKGTMEHG